MDNLRQFEPVEFRHAHVHDDDGDVGFQQVYERLPPRPGLNQILVQFTENDFIAEQLVRLVIDHENIDFLVRAHSSPSESSFFFRRYRCSHIRSADNSWSVLTGLAR